MCRLEKTTALTTAQYGHTHAHTHTRMRAHTHTHTHTHTHMRSHTHVLDLERPSLTNSLVMIGCQAEQWCVRSELRLNILGAGKLVDHGSGRWRSAIDVPPLTPILCQQVALSERDVSKHQVTSNDVAPSIRRAMTRTGTRELRELHKQTSGGVSQDDRYDLRSQPTYQSHTTDKKFPQSYI